jgi:hypothetical protein
MALFGGTLPIPGDIDSASRFARAASFLKTLPEPKDYREAILDPSELTLVGDVSRSFTKAGAQLMKGTPRLKRQSVEHVVPSA